MGSLAAVDERKRRLPATYRTGAVLLGVVLSCLGCALCRVVVIVGIVAAAGLTFRPFSLRARITVVFSGPTLFSKATKS